MKQTPTALTAGEVKGGLTKSFIFNEKSLAYPAAQEAEVTAEALASTAYGLELFQEAFTLYNLSPFVRDSLVYKRDAFLRNGFISRRYSELYPQEIDDYPSPGQPITPKAGYPQKIFDEHTGHNTYKRMIKADRVLYRAHEAFIDYTPFKGFWEQVPSGTGKAKAKEYNLTGQFYGCAAYPSFTLTKDREFSRFLDDNIKPTTDPAKTYFDKDKNEFYKKIIKEDIIGQVQAKHKNVQRYSVEKLALPYHRFEIQDPKKITKDDPDQTKLYITKDDQNKYKYPEALSIFTSYLALTIAIRQTVMEMITTDVPTNRASYDPFKTSKNTTDYEDYGKTTPENLRILMNPIDLAFVKQNIINTSEQGNYRITLDDVTSQGVTIYAIDTMPPGMAIVEEKDIFEVVEFHDSNYFVKADFLLAEQYGRHYMGKVKVGGWRCWKKLIPSHGFVSADVLDAYIFKDIKPS